MKEYLKGLIVLMVFIIGLIVFNNFNLIGMAVWEPISNNNCSENEIGIIWDSVFVESNSSIVILGEDEVGGNCEKYIAYKNNTNGELWVLFGENYNLTSWGGDYRYFNNGRVLTRFNLSFAYFNATSLFIESFNAESGIDSKISFLEGVTPQDLTNWSVRNVLNLSDKLDELYKFSSISGENFSDSESYFDFRELIDNNMNYSDFGIAIHKNKSFSQGEYFTMVNDPVFVVEILKDIPNYNFNVNSSWNSAFNLNDYFNISDDVVINFSDTGANNTNGELINYSINGSNVSFKPAVNFDGSVRFELIANNPAGNNIYSNIFNVTIDTENNAPILIKNFEQFSVLYNDSLLINLGDYFEDPDGDTLIYSTSGTNGVNVSIVDSILTLSLNNYFSIYSKFKIYANDGTDGIGSNWVFVYENIASNVLDENIINETSVNNSFENITNDDVIRSGSSKTTSKSDANWIKWLVWGIIIIVVLGIIMFAIWFFILRKDNGSIVPDSSGPVQPIAPQRNPSNTLINRVIPQKGTIAPQRKRAPILPHPIK